MKKLFVPLVMLGALWALPALALDLQQARAAGQVGEKADGYAAAIAGSSEVKALVDDVNARRRQEYGRISKENGQPADVVAKLAAQQIIGGLPAGARYQDASGAWKTK